MSRLAVALSVLMLAGCGDATGILIEVRSDDLAVPGEVDSLRFEVRSNDGRTVDSTYPIGNAWPHSLTVVPRSNLDTSVTITVTGMRQGAFVVRRVIRAEFSPGTTRLVQVVLARECVGVMCEGGVDCVDGACVGVPTLDGGVDAGTDVDAGPPEDGGGGDDAGVDAGAPPTDAGVDSGTDAGVDAGRDAGTDAGQDAGTDAGPPPPMLMFSEYVQGGPGNNKALEIQNLSSVSFDLGRCILRRFSNGSSTGSNITLAGTVAGGGVFAICHSSIEGTPTCDQLNSNVNHTGNDAYTLVCDGSVLVDSIGRVGEDPPGGGWSGGGLSTQGYVLRRLCPPPSGAGAPDTDPSDAFDPSAQWTGFVWSSPATTAHAGLGSRSECP